MAIISNKERNPSYMALKVVAFFMVVVTVLVLSILYHYRDPVYPGVYRFQCDTQVVQATFANSGKSGTGKRSDPLRKPEKGYHDISLIPLVELRDGNVFSFVKVSWSHGRAYTYWESIKPGTKKFSFISEKWMYPEEFVDRKIAKHKDISKHIFLVYGQGYGVVVDQIGKEEWYVYEFSVDKLPEVKRDGLTIPDVRELTKLSEHKQGDIYWKAYRNAINESKKFDDLY